jgi:hypothetical protein
MSEKELMQQIQIEVSKLGGRVFRNNVGTFRGSDGSYNRTGLCIGSSDLIGWFPRPGFYGDDGSAVFLAIEVKTPTGKVRPEQIQFINTVNKSGGIAFIARSVEDVRRNLCDKRA